MFLLLPIFCCYFFLIYLFVTAKAALPKIVLKKLSGLGSETSKSINSSVVRSSYEDLFKLESLHLIHRLSTYTVAFRKGVC